MVRFLLLSIAAALPLTGAIAQPPVPPVRGDVPIRYNDLDLTKTADAHRMLDRLKRAADLACGGSPTLRQVSPGYFGVETKAFRNCRNEALAKAVNALGAPTVDWAFAQETAETQKFAHR